MLTDLVRAKRYAGNWQEAIAVSGEVLVAANAVEPAYVQAMIEGKEEFGPYIVIAPGVAMPHARPEAGVIKPAVAIVTLSTPVAFGHEQNDPVDVVIAFAAQSKEAHLETLKEIAGLVSSPVRLERLRAATNDTELIEAQRE